MKTAMPRRRTMKSLDDIKALLRGKLPELKMSHGVMSLEIFGSWVRGEQTRRSDLDLLIEFEPARKISLFSLVSLEQDLSDYLGIPVDLVEKGTVKPRLRNRILNEAVPV